MPVYVLREKMPYTELLNWIEFFRRRPPGYQEDMRTYMLLSAQGFKGKPEDIFPTIHAVKAHSENKYTEDQAIPKGIMLAKMLTASDGDGASLNWLTGDKHEIKLESS